MAQLNFPDNPIDGQLYPNPCPSGVTQYQWDSGTGIWRIVGTATGVTPGTYGNEVTVGQFTVDVAGKLTDAVNIPIRNASLTAPGIVQLTTSLSSFSESVALTAKAGKLLQDQIGNLNDCIVPDHVNVVAALNDLQRQSTNLQTNALIWCGYYNAEQGIISFVSGAGQSLGYVVGTRLPAADLKNSGDFFIVTVAGNPFADGDSNAPNVFLPNSDWIVSEGNRWVAVNASGGIVKASDVSYVPSAPLTATNVQNAIYQLTQLLRSGVGGATISPEKPLNPYPGQLWWDDDEGIFYIYYTDVNSSQWVELGGGGSSGLGGGGDGTVYEVRTGIGLIGGPITTEGTIDLVPAFRDQADPADSTIGGVIPNLGFDYDNNTGLVDLKISDDPSGSDPYTAFSQKGANILQQEIQAIAGVNILAGTYNAETGQLVYVTPVAQNKGFVVGRNLPAPSVAIDNYYVIVIRGGDQGPNGRQVSQAGDWYICQADGGTAPVWFLIDYENISALAANVSVVPPIPGISSANDVQRALEAIEVQVQDRLEFVLPTTDGLQIQVSDPAFDSNDGTTLSIGLDYASTTDRGIVQLSNDVTGNSQTVAITQFAANTLNSKIDALVGSNVLAGTYNSFTGQVASVTPAGTAAGFRIGQQAPVATSVPDNYYLIVTISGSFGPPGAIIPPTGIGAGDWFVVENEPGTSPTWVTIDFERASATASNVSITPVPGLTASNVQQAVQQLTDRTEECITGIISTNNGITAITQVSNANFGLETSLTLEPATAADIGGVFIPPNVGLNVTTAGGLSVKPATKTSIGGIIVGDNLTIDAQGRLSATGGGGGGTAQDIVVSPPIQGIESATNVYTALQQIETQVQSVTGTNVLAGTYDAKNGVMVYVTPAGFAKGFRVGVNVPAATTAIDNYYVIVTIGGGAGPTGAQVSQAGDWYICQADGGTQAVWFLIDFENITALASNISVVPIPGITGAKDVQRALEQIELQVQDRIETVNSTTPELKATVSQPSPTANDGTTLTLNVDYASVNGKGLVQLTNDLTGNSSSLAITQAAGNVLDKKIQALTGGSVLAGTYDANTGLLVSVTPAGAAQGFKVGSNCPAPSRAIDNFYVIIVKGGSKAPPGTTGPTVSQSGDWYFCEAEVGQTAIWLLIDFENREVAAVNVTLQNITGLTATNVQAGMQQLETQVQNRIGTISDSSAGGLKITTGAAGVNGKTTSISLLPAKANDIGGVFVAANQGLNLNATNGQLSLGIASATVLGGIKVGSGLKINATTGVLDVTAGGTGTVTSVSGTGTVSGLTLTGTVTTAGNLVLGGSITTPSPNNWFNDGFVKVIGGTGLDAGIANVGKELRMHSDGTANVNDIKFVCNGLGQLTIGAASGSTTVTSGTFSGAFSGNGASITALNANNISTGTLAIARGGTAGTTAVAARTNLLPSQSGQAGKFLKTNGTDVSWEVPSGGGSGTVTSVGLKTSTTGVNISGSPITTNGTITLDLNVPGSSNWFNNGFLSVRDSDGLVQTGRYIDFHTNKTSTTYDVRLDAAATGTLNIVAGGGAPTIVKSSGGFGVLSSSAGFTGGFARLTGNGYADGESTLTVTGGGIESRPGGGVASPGFILNSASGANPYFGGLYLNVANEQVGVSSGGAATMLFGKTLNVSMNSLEVRGGSELRLLGSSGGTAATPLFQIQRTGTDPGYVGAFVQTVSGESRFGISVGSAPGSMAATAAFGPTTATINGTLQGTTKFVNISATGTGVFGGKVTGSNFANAGGQFTVTSAGAVSGTTFSASSSGSTGTPSFAIGTGGTGLYMSTDGALGASSPAICLNGSKVVSFGAAVVQSPITAAGNVIKIPGMATGQAGTNVYISGNSNTLYKMSSSLRYKKNIETLEEEYGLEAVMNLRPVRYDAKSEPSSTGPGKYVGFIAEECEDYPELMVYDEEGQPESLILDNLRPIHHLAIQQLKRENDDLRDIIAGLVTRIEALENP